MEKETRPQSDMMRWPLALVYIYGGLEGLWQLLIGPPWLPPVTAGAGAFMGALVVGFTPLWAVIKTVEGVGAILLLMPRFAPLGTIFVLPITIVIVIFQFTINFQFGAPIGAIVAAAQLLAIWAYRREITAALGACRP